MGRRLRAIVREPLALMCLTAFVLTIVGCGQPSTMLTPMSASPRVVEEPTGLPPRPATSEHVERGTPNPEPAAALGGAATTPGPPVPEPATDTTRTDQESSPPLRPQARLDRGAIELIRQLTTDRDLARDSTGWTNVDLGDVDNQSHATPQEFDRFRARLAELLTGAGEPNHLRFHPVAGNEPSQYHIRTGAYLRMTAGLEVWELFPAMVSEEGVTAWRCSGPVLVLRSPRPNQPQILIVKDPN